MTTMGNIGNFYIILLVLILLAGSAFLALNLARKYWYKAEELIEKKGGKTLNKWIKLALVSFTGIILATFALGIVNSISGQDAHSAHGGGASHGNNTAVGYRSGQMMPVSTPAGQASLEAQIYQLQMTMMQMQQQMQQITQMYMNQQMNQSMPSSSGGMNMGGSGSSGGMGGMSMM